MKITELVEGTHILRVDDTYTPDELDLVWMELALLDSALEGPDKTGGAVSLTDGHHLKSNQAVFLNRIYREPDHSPIWRKAVELIGPEMRDAYIGVHPCHCTYSTINLLMPLVSKYDDGDHYEEHQDKSLYTAITYLFREPRTFFGGDTTVRVGGALVSLPMISNTTYVFPGGYPHSVSQVTGTGRYAISTFMHFAP